MGVEVGELNCEPSLWRCWHDLARDLGGRAIYLLTEKAQIQIEVDELEGAILVPFPNYDQARSAMRNENECARLIEREITDLNSFVEFATD